MPGWIAVERSEHSVSLTLIKRSGLKVERIQVRVSSATSPCLLLRSMQKPTTQSDPAVPVCDPEEVDVQPLPPDHANKAADHGVAISSGQDERLKVWRFSVLSVVGTETVQNRFTRSLCRFRLDTYDEIRHRLEHSPYLELGVHFAVRLTRLRL
jgi:hypothetical protein